MNKIITKLKTLDDTMLIDIGLKISNMQTKEADILFPAILEEMEYRDSKMVIRFENMLTEVLR